jgi:short-subunit dehydrogenase
MKKTAVVTGGTKGIGKSIVLHLASNGFEVITNGRSQSELEALHAEVLEKTNNKLFFMRADFENKNEVFAFAEYVNKTFDKLNILVNNAGIFIPGQSLKEEDGIYEKEMAINLTAPYYLTRQLYPLLAKSQDAYIFNMCSTASFTAYVNGGSYCISKFGLLGFTKVLREELKLEKIGVSAIMPGATLTNSWLGTDLPPSHFMQPENVAHALWMAWENRSTMVMEEIILRPYPGDIS